MFKQFNNFCLLIMRYAWVLFLLPLSTGICMNNTARQSHSPESGIVLAAANPRIERKALAVIRFVNTTPRDHADRFQPWELGIPAMLTSDLEATQLFNIVDRGRIEDIIRELDLQKSSLVDPSTAVAMGKLTAAKYLLTGTFMEMNGNLKITSQVISVETGVQLGAASVMGKTDSFFTVEKQLFSMILDYLKVMLTEAQKVEIENTIETKSIEASLKNYAGEETYMKVEELQKEGKKKEAAKLKKEAKQLFKEAIKEDPNYQRPKKNMKRLMMHVPVTL